MGRKGLNVNFTVHKVEQLNLKERTCRRLQDRRNWSVRACVLPPSVSWVHIWQFSCLVWFIAEFLFWWGVHDGFGHIFTDPPQKSPVWALSPKHWGQCTDCRERAMMPWVPIVAQWVTNPISTHEDEDLIPGLAQWVNDPLCFCGCDQQPQLRFDC